MQIIGFNLTKMSAEKSPEKHSSRPSIGIEFTNLEKEKVEILKEGEAIKLSFKHSIIYEDAEKKDSEKKKESNGSVIFEGIIILSVTKEESKEINKSWKKQQLPSNMNLALFNFILRRCTPKAVALQDEIGLPISVPIPKISPGSNQNQGS